MPIRPSQRFTHLGSSDANRLVSERWQSFTALLDLVPRIDDAKATAPGEAESNGRYLVGAGPPFAESLFELVCNEGGGDCLFHALEGKNLAFEDVVALRDRVADEREAMEENPLRNRDHVEAALRQTPFLAEDALDLLIGRARIPNRVYAALQRIPGIYAGEDEIHQWCRLSGKSVAIVNAIGILLTFSAQGRKVVVQGEKTDRDLLTRVLENCDVGVFKSSGHWERIRRLRRTLQSS